MQQKSGLIEAKQGFEEARGDMGRVGKIRHACEDFSEDMPLDKIEGPKRIHLVIPCT